MPEVFNKAGGSVDLSRLKAAEVTPTVGSEGRVSVTSLRSGITGLATTVASVADDIFANRSAQKKAEQEAAENVIQSQAAVDVENLYFAANNENADELARIATGYQDVMGDELSPKQLSALSAYQVLRDKADEAIKQGKPELAVRLAMNRQRVRLLSEHPELGPDLLDIAGKIKSLGDDQLNLEFEEEKKERERREAANTEMTDDLRSVGFDVTGLSFGEKQVVWEQVRGQNVRSLAELERQQKVLAADVSISESKKKLLTSELLTKSVGNVAQEVELRLLKAARAPGSGEQRAEALLTESNRAKAELIAKTGLTGPDFDNLYGFIFTNTQKLADDVRTGKIGQDEAAAKLALRKIAAEMTAREQLGVEAEAVAATVDLLGKGAEAMALDPDYRASMMRAMSPVLEIAALRGQAALEAVKSGDKSVPFSEVQVNRNPDTNRVLAGPEIKVEAAKDAIVVDTLLREKTPVAEKAALDLSLSHFIQAGRTNDMTGLHEQMAVTASPEFGAAIKGREVPAEAGPILLNYMDRINASSKKRFAVWGGDNIGMQADENGEIRFSFLRPPTGIRSGSREDFVDAQRELAKLEAWFNNGVKTYANLRGISYPEALRDVAKSQAARGNTGQ